MDVIAEKARDHVAPAVVEGLLSRSAEVEHGVDREPSPRDIVFQGGLSDFTELFEERLWSDGLPVIPPTLDRVDQFLAHTNRSSEEILGTLAPEHREATVWSVAVNGVMAGCRPEYMPILVAVVEAIADTAFRIQDGGSTPGWEPMMVLSGPIVKRLGFNSGPGLMRVGYRPNTSVGRFLRLYIRNIAGLRAWPGTTDKGSIGASFHVVMAEDDDATLGIGWVPTRVEDGFSLDDDVVTVRSVVAVSLPTYTGGSGPDGHLEELARMLSASCGPWIGSGLIYRVFKPLLLLSPHVAGALAAGGLEKDDVRAYLHEHAKVKAAWLTAWAHHIGAGASDLPSLIAAGVAPPEYAESDDPERLVPSLLRPEWTTIVVAGDAARNQSRFYINNHAQGAPVSRRVTSPARQTRECASAGSVEIGFRY